MKCLLLPWNFRYPPTLAGALPMGSAILKVNAVTIVLWTRSFNALAIDIKLPATNEADSAYN
jgi:hypothetical protein